VRKDVLSSSDGAARFWEMACEVNSSPLVRKSVSLSLLRWYLRREHREREEAYRTSQRRPSAAVCFLVLSSFRTRDCRSSDSRGAASCLSLIFCRIFKFESWRGCGREHTDSGSNEP
jgi:hypothetical protein